MTLKDVRRGSPPPAITSMDEIQQRKGMPFDEFCAEHPWWEWTESRLARRMIDDQARAWVPMWNPDPGVGICYDPELTPQAEVYLAELVRKLDEDQAAGKLRLWDLDELDELDVIEGVQE